MLSGFRNWCTRQASAASQRQGREGWQGTPAAARTVALEQYQIQRDLTRSANLAEGLSAPPAITSIRKQAKLIPNASPRKSRRSRRVLLTAWNQ